MKPFKGVNHGTGPIDLTHLKNVEELRPVEIHLKENGSLKNGPSFAIVLTDNDRYKQAKTIIGQISLEMLNDELADIGYEITPLVTKEPFLKS